jgi:Tfp pilus assembly protein PilO
MANQQQALAKLKTRIPPSGQMPRLLDVLLDYVERASLKVVNVQQGTLAPAEDEQHVPIVLDGAACFSLPVTLSVEGSFRDVVAFLERVASQKFPGLVTVDRAHLASKDPFSATLSASLQLVLYVVGS